MSTLLPNQLNNTFLFTLVQYLQWHCSLLIAEYEFLFIFVFVKTNELSSIIGVSSTLKKKQPMQKTTTQRFSILMKRKVYWPHYRKSLNALISFRPSLS